MLGIGGLDQHLAGAAAAAGAAGDLHDGLREPLGGAKVGAEQSLVRIEHHDQRHVLEVMALGDHLRADQDARRTAVDAVHGRVHVRPAAHDVAVHAHQRRLREQFAQRLLDPLGALADRAHREAALRAVLRAAARRRRSDDSAAGPSADAPSCAHRSPGTARSSRRPCTAASAHSRGGSGTRAPGRRRARCRSMACTTGVARPAVTAWARRSTSARRGGAPVRRGAAATAAGSARSRRSAAFPARASPSPAPPAPARAARAPAPGRAPNSGSRPRAASARRRAPRPR